MVYYWFVFLWQAGGTIFSVDYTVPRSHEPAEVEALAFWQRLVEEGSVPLAPPEDGFEKEQIAIVLATTARMVHYTETLEERLGVAPLACGRECATGVGGANLAILANCTHSQEAWKFVRWVSSPQVNLHRSVQTGYLPQRRSVVASETYQAYLAVEPRAGVISQQMDVARARPNIPPCAAVSREVDLAIEEALFTATDPATVLTAAADRSIPLLNPQ